MSEGNYKLYFVCPPRKTSDGRTNRKTFARIVYSTHYTGFLSVYTLTLMVGFFSCPSFSWVLISHPDELFYVKGQHRYCTTQAAVVFNQKRTNKINFSHNAHARVAPGKHDKTSVLSSSSFSTRSRQPRPDVDKPRPPILRSYYTLLSNRF